MKAKIRRWSSTGDETFGHEFLSRPLLPGELAGALRGLPSEVGEGAFLLARLAPSDHSGVAAAMRAVEALQPCVRASLFVDLATARGLASRPVDAGDVGLLLDGVTIATPLSALVSHAIEGIRFDQSFIESASTDLRADAALRAILALAHDLALSTFASLSNDVAPSPGVASMLQYVSGAVPVKSNRLPLGAFDAASMRVR